VNRQKPVGPVKANDPLTLLVVVAGTDDVLTFAPATGSPVSAVNKRPVTWASVDPPPGPAGGDGPDGALHAIDVAATITKAEKRGCRNVM
jgi:hypothetical protein